jgi:hypothetical protein
MLDTEYLQMSVLLPFCLLKILSKKIIIGREHELSQSWNHHEARVSKEWLA